MLCLFSSGSVVLCGVIIGGSPDHAEVADGKAEELLDVLVVLVQGLHTRRAGGMPVRLMAAAAIISIVAMHDLAYSVALSSWLAVG